MTVIVSDKMQHPYNTFLTDTIEKLSEFKIRGLAVVAICEDENAITGYWNMNLRDKAAAEVNIRYDCIDQMLLANKDRYLEEPEDDD